MTLTRARFIAMLLSAGAALGFVPRMGGAEEPVWPVVDEDVAIGNGWNKECKNVATCFNDNNGLCWGVIESCGSCTTHGFVGYRIADYRCAYVKRDTSGAATDKLCISNSSVCATKCRSCG